MNTQEIEYMCDTCGLVFTSTKLNVLCECGGCVRVLREECWGCGKMDKLHHDLCDTCYSEKTRRKHVGGVEKVDDAILRHIYIIHEGEKYFLVTLKKCQQKIVLPKSQVCITNVANGWCGAITTTVHIPKWLWSIKRKENPKIK